MDAIVQEARAGRIDFRPALRRLAAAGGSGVGRIVIPRIGDDFAVVKGTSAADLRRGAGFYDWAGLPGEPRAVAIAGHRTTYSAAQRYIVLARLRSVTPT
jgi:sortase (surface protein transpeptidase)